jgi:hypothetical protein
MISGLLAVSCSAGVDNDGWMVMISLPVSSNNSEVMNNKCKVVRGL